jgi:hypothetical protein
MRRSERNTKIVRVPTVGALRPREHVFRLSGSVPSRGWDEEGPVLQNGAVCDRRDSIYATHEQSMATP